MKEFDEILRSDSGYVTCSIYNISLITGWTVYTEKYKARGPDV